MTDSIKPPGFGPTLHGVTGSMGGAAPAETPAASPNVGVTGASGPRTAPAALAEQLQRGELTATQVVDALVARALEQARAQGLPATEQAGLEQVLRAALASDPTLSGLARSLER